MDPIINVEEMSFLSDKGVMKALFLKRPVLAAYIYLRSFIKGRKPDISDLETLMTKHLVYRKEGREEADIRGNGESNNKRSGERAEYRN